MPHGKGGFWCLWNAMEELHAGGLPWWRNAAASERGHALLGYSAPYPREMLGWLEVIVLSGKSQKSSSRRWQHSLQWAFLLEKEAEIWLLPDTASFVGRQVTEGRRTPSLVSCITSSSEVTVSNSTSELIVHFSCHLLAVDGNFQRLQMTLFQDLVK